MKRERPAVYCIKCPDTLKPVYVGASFYPSKRFRAHMNSKTTPVGNWIQSLKVERKNPIFEILQQFNPACYDAHCNISSHLGNMEWKWIYEFKKRGYKLFNKHNYRHNAKRINGVLTDLY